MIRNIILINHLIDVAVRRNVSKRRQVSSQPTGKKTALSGD